MPVIANESGLLIVRLAISGEEIPDLLERHRTKWAPPARLEAEGLFIREQQFPVSRCARFAEEVITWGRGHRFLGRFLEKNPEENIATAMSEASASVSDGDVPGAVSRMQDLRQLGQSFASKIVRFLHPDKAVILDDVIRRSLGYRADSNGYAEFLSDCETILRAVKPDYPHLRVSDVEAAIFSKIQGY